MRALFLCLLLLFPCFTFGGLRRFYFAPDFYYYWFKEKPSAISKAKENGFLVRYQLGYDSTAPFCLYYGLQISRVKARVRHVNDLLALKTSTDNSVTNYEGRVGMCLALFPRFYFTPLFALGYRDWTRITEDTEDSKYSYACTYKGYGVRMLYRARSWLDLGLYFKILQPMHVDLKVERLGEISLYAIGLSYLHGKWPKLKLKNKLQYEIELPIYFKAPSFQLIDIALVPYFKDLAMGKSTSKSQTGGTLYAGSSAAEVGLRLEIGINL